MIALSALFVFVLSSCWSNQSQVDVKYVAEKLISYSQEAIQKTTQNPCDIGSQERIYQNMETEFQDIMEEDMIKDVQIKIIPFMIDELSSYSLPVQVQSISIENGDSQTLTVKFIDQNHNQGDVVLRMQENKGKISYVGVYKQ